MSNNLRKLFGNSDIQILKTVYQAYIEPSIFYSAEAWLGSVTTGTIKKLNREYERFFQLSRPQPDLKVEFMPLMPEELLFVRSLQKYHQIARHSGSIYKNFLPPLKIEGYDSYNDYVQKTA